MGGIWRDAAPLPRDDARRRRLDGGDRTVVHRLEPSEADREEARLLRVRRAKALLETAERLRGMGRPFEHLLAQAERLLQDEAEAVAEADD